MYIVGKPIKWTLYKRQTEQSHNGEGGAAMSERVQIRQQMLLLWCSYCYHVEVICATTTTCFAAIVDYNFKLLFLLVMLFYLRF